MVCDLRMYTDNEKEMKRIKEQRAVHGFCDHDLYDLNEFIAEILHDSLTQFSHVMVRDSYPPNVAGVNSPEEWAARLQKVANDIRDIAYCPGDMINPRKEEIHKAFKELAEIFEWLFWC